MRQLGKERRCCWGCELDPSRTIGAEQALGQGAVKEAIFVCLVEAKTKKDGLEEKRSELFGMGSEIEMGINGEEICRGGDGGR